MFDPMSDLLRTYWSIQAVKVNLLVFANLVGALLLGAVVGYERAYRGRAAGMRTYGLVCMAAAGLTVVAGQPAHWFGGVTGVAAVADPTRVIQGIVTGIGFLGAGVIIKEGMHISGLTTAASIWSASCIGVLVGVGFYAAAILLATLSACTMLWGCSLERHLPTHPAVRITVAVRGALWPLRDELTRRLAAMGYDIAGGSFTVTATPEGDQSSFVAVVADRARARSLLEVADSLRQMPQLQSVKVEHERN